MPIARARATWGALASGKRLLTLTVVDRLGNRYSPAEFAENASAGGTVRSGRWCVWWAVAATEHGAAVTVTPDTPAAGRTLGQLGQVWQVITDERGVWSALVTVAGVPTVHTAAGVVGLLQSRAGLVWATAAGETAE